MNQIKKWMQGRYGFDQLTQFLIMAALFFSLLGLLTQVRGFAYLSYVPFVVAIFRTLSKDCSKRAQENHKFSQWFNPKFFKMKRKVDRMKTQKNFKYFCCPECKQKVRVPRKKGKIQITCPKCTEKFVRKT